MKKVIDTPVAPRAIGPYSQAVRANGLLFLSGQLPIDPVTNDMAYGGIAVQVHQVFANLKAILRAEELSLSDVVKCTVFLADMDEFAAMNKAYAEYFKDDFPARVCVQARLPRNAGVEIEAIAVYPD